MCGSSAANSYGSLGSSCAMRPPRRRNRSGQHGIVHQKTTPNFQHDDKTNSQCWELASGSGLELGVDAFRLLDGKHPIERHLRPVLLLVGDDDAIVHAALDELLD